MSDKKMHAATKTSRVGEKRIASNGQMMEIIAYRRWEDIDVRFEDGTEVYSKQYGKFLTGSIKNPNAPLLHKNYNQTKKKRKSAKDYIGQKSIASNGMRIQIIAYRGYADVDVKFEDGTIVNGVPVYCFQKGWVKYETEEERLQKISIAYNGMSMKIHEYRNAHDIDIIFEDGEIVKNKTYDSFLKGTVKHPNGNSTLLDYKKKRVGENRIAHNGMWMTIIAYRKEGDIDIQFEDGTIVKNKTYNSFKRGNIRNPNKKGYRTSSGPYRKKKKDA